MVLQGIGEPFPGARKDYPEVCGENLDEEEAIAYKVEGKELAKIKSDRMDYWREPIGPAVDMLRDIFDSGDELISTTLLHGIEACHRAVSITRRQSEEINELKKERAEIELFPEEEKEEVREIFEKMGLVEKR